MDYKYIEQLLERYFECETTLEEEQILRTFFCQKDVPVGLLKYKDLFVYQNSSKEEEKLSEDFDAKILQELNIEPPVKAREIKISDRLRPLFKAAAMVAMILTIGMAAQMPYHNEEPEVNQVAVMEDTVYKGPSMAMGDSIQKVDSLPKEINILK